MTAATILAAYPAGDPRASLRADRAARQYEQHGQPVRVEFAADRDEFVIVPSTEENRHSC